MTIPKTPHTIDAAQISFLQHIHVGAANDLLRALEILESHCEDIRRDIQRHGVSEILITPGNIGAAAARLEAACETVKATRDACKAVDVPYSMRSQLASRQATEKKA